MAVAGIDISSFAVDVVLLDDDTDRADWHRFELAGGTPFERARSLRGRFVSRSWWENRSCYLVGIEDPHSRFPHVAKALGTVTGAVAAMLPVEMTVIQTAPKEWKRIAVGNANASKVYVALWCHDHGFPATGAEAAHIPQDACDAFCIAYAVRALNNEAIQRGAA